MSEGFESPRTHAHGTDRLKDKVSVITGAGQGIGRAAAHRMAAEGAVIMVADANEEAARRTHDELRAAGGRVAMFVGNLMDWSTCMRLIEQTIQQFGRVDVLVNNVGGATDLKPFHEWGAEEILAEMHRSILPTLWCCRAVLPHMLERRYGRIVNVGAESVRNGLWDRAPYNAGKGAVIGITTSIARETAPFGITCNIVSPGPTESERDRMVEHGIRTKEASSTPYRVELSRKMMGTVPMNRRAASQEHAAAIAFMASDDVGHITGHMLSAGGGMNML